jgi:hypothetical protein
LKGGTRIKQPQGNHHTCAAKWEEESDFGNRKTNEFIFSIVADMHKSFYLPLLSAIDNLVQTNIVGGLHARYLRATEASSAIGVEPKYERQGMNT